MSENRNEAAQQRRRWINVGEIVAVAGLVISGLALWNSWGSKDDKPASAPIVVEKPRAIPLSLRGKVEEDGKSLSIAPVEASHALDSLTLTAPGKPPVELGNDPSLSASTIEGLLPDTRKRVGSGTLPVTLDARYVEAGNALRKSGRYEIRYRWAGGGLFGGHSLRLTALSRA